METIFLLIIFMLRLYVATYTEFISYSKFILLGSVLAGRKVMKLVRWLLLLYR